MTLSEVLVETYAAVDQQALPLFLACVGVPVVGSVAAWIGRGGRVDRDGRLFANLTVGFGLVVLVLQVVAIGVARAAFDAPLLSANILLLIGPPLALTLALFGVRLVFPLSQLGSARTARSAVLLVLLVLGLVWLFSQFRGWGVVFFGSIAQLAALGALGWLLLKRLGRGATGRDPDVHGGAPPRPRR